MGNLKTKKIKKISLILGAAFIFGAVFLNFKAQAFVFNNNETKGKTTIDEVFVLNSFDGLNIKTNFRESLTLPVKNGVFQKEYTYTSFVKKADFLFNAIAFHYNASQPQNTEIILKVRTSFDGENFSDWMVVEKDNDLLGGPKKTSDVFSELIFQQGHYYQYQIILKTGDPAASPVIKNFKVTTINSLNGPNPLKKNKAQAAEPIPRIISRSEWGADPKYMTWTPQYADVKVFILHHTAGANNPTDPAATMRGIYYYHAVTLGWGDIGYNFVLDQYGNIYEGRYGGSRVVGGHAKGYNTGSCGIAVMGTYTSSYLNNAQIESLSRLIGYKSVEYNINPLGKTYFVDKTINNISGHRDVNSTSCPGDAFYSQLPLIRTKSTEKLSAYLANLLKISNFSLSSEILGLGEEIEFKFILNNTINLPIVLNGVTVAIRYGDQNINQDLPFIEKINLAPLEKRQFTLKGKFNRTGNYKAFVVIKINQSFYLPEPINGDKEKTFQVIVPDIRLTQVPQLDPQFPLINQPFKVTFKVKNFSQCKAVIPSLAFVVRFNGQNKDLPPISTILNPGQEYTFSQEAKYSERGTYTGWVAALWPDGIWRRIVGENNFSQSSFYIASTPAKIELSSSLKITPNQPLVGQEVLVSFKIKNLGDQPYLSKYAVAVRFDPANTNQNKDFSLKEILVPSFGEVEYLEKNKFETRGEYIFWIVEYKNDKWLSVTHPQLVFRTTTFVYQSPPDVKITSSLQATPQSPVVGSPVTLTFKVKNFGDQPITIPIIAACVRLNGQNRDFPGVSITLNGGQEYTYSQTKVLTEKGSYYGFISGFVNNKWTTFPLYSNQISTITIFSVEESSEKIKLLEFVAPKDNIGLGEEALFKFKIKNLAPVDLTIEKIGIATRLNQNINRDFGFQSLSIKAGEEKTFEIKSSFKEVGSYKVWIAYLIKDKWYSALTLNGQRQEKTFQVIVPDIRLTQAPQLDPQFPLINQPFKVTFKVKNFSQCKAVIPSLAFVVRFNGQNKDLPPISTILNPGQEYTFSQEAKYSERGTYTGWVAMLLQDGIWRRVVLENGQVQTNINFQIMIPPDPKITSSLSVNPQAPVIGSPVTLTFKVKNFGDQPIRIPIIAACVRLNGQNRDFPGVSITLKGGEEYTYSQTKVLTEKGSYYAFISSFYDNNWNPSFPPSLNNTIQRKLTFEVKEGSDAQIYNLIPYTPVVVTSERIFKMKISSQYAELSPGTKIEVKYWQGKYYIKNANTVFSTTTAPRFEGEVIKVVSYNDIPSWNTSLNDNEFRGVIEVVYSSTSNKLWVVNELSLEDYLKGIAETSSSSPPEHLKTMTVAARSYAYWHIIRGGKHKGEPFHLKNSRNGNGDDQQYKGYGLEKRFPQLVQAVEQTRGEIVAYNGAVALTTYFSRSDGRTRSAQEVWGWTWAPWLVSVSDPDCVGMTLSGHGVGLSGYGSLKKAERGENYKSILSYYYKNTSIMKVDNPLIRVAIYGISL